MRGTDDLLIDRTRPIGDQCMTHQTNVRSPIDLNGTTRPALRPLDIRHHSENGRPYLLLRDPLQLSDGRFGERTDEAIWFERGCVGWQGPPLATIFADLGEPQPIELPNWTSTWPDCANGIAGARH